MSLIYDAIIALRFVIPLLYLIASIGYVAVFIKDQDFLFSWIKPAYVAGLLLQSLLIVFLIILQGVFPFNTVVRGLFFCSWILAILFLLTEKIHQETSYGAFFMPINFIITGFTLLFLNSGAPLPNPMVSYYFIIHVTLLFIAYACFLYSFIVSIMYLLQHHEIKMRRLGSFFSRLPSLDTMDQTVKFMDALGLSLIFLGIVTGFLWLDAFNMAVSTNIPVKAGFIMITLFIYLSEHLLRIGKGWKGKRACLISIAGFLFVLCTLIVGRHGY